MAWNRPGNKQKVKNALQQNGLARPAVIRFAIAGMVVIAIGSTIAIRFFFSSTQNPGSGTLHKTSLIKEIHPSIRSNATFRASPPQVKIVSYKTNETGRIMRFEDGEPRWLHWRKPPSKHGIVKVSLDDPQSKQVEDIAMEGMPATDLYLAYLFNAKPGNEFGDAIDLDDFAKRFINSLKTPIIVSREDLESVKEIKRGVIELRKELKDLYDAGEDIEKVVKDARNALVKDYQYRQELLKEIDARIESGEITKADAEDLYNAANVMLNAKGLKNVKMSNFMKRCLDRQEKKRQMHSQK